jgi:hypothetical protein
VSRYLHDREFWILIMGGVGGYSFAKTESILAAVVIGVCLGVAYAILDDILEVNEEEDE